MNAIIDQFPAIKDLLEQRNNWHERLQRAVAIKQSVNDEVQRETSRCIAGINSNGADYYCRQVDINCWLALPRLVGYAQLLDGKRLKELERRLQEMERPFVRDLVAAEVGWMRSQMRWAIQDSTHEIASNLDWCNKTSFAGPVLLRKRYSLEYCTDQGWNVNQKQHPAPILTPTGLAVLADIDKMIAWNTPINTSAPLVTMVRDALEQQKKIDAPLPIVVEFDYGTIKLFKSSMQFIPSEELQQAVNKILQARDRRVRDVLTVA